MTTTERRYDLLTYEKAEAYARRLDAIADAMPEDAGNQMRSVMAEAERIYGPDAMRSIARVGKRLKAQRLRMYSAGYAEGMAMYADGERRDLVSGYDYYSKRATLPDSSYEQGIRDALAERINA